MHMHLEVKRSGKIRERFAKLFQKKALVIPVFSLVVVALGFGIYSAVRGYSSTDTAHVTKKTNSRSYTKGTVDTSFIRYGVDPDNANTTWGTYRYNVSTSTGDHTGMCLQPNISGPNDQDFYITTNTTSDAQLIKEIMLVSIDGLDSSIKNAFDNANSGFWSNVASNVQNLQRRDTSVGYGECVLTDYYFGVCYSGCGGGACDSLTSQVPVSDYTYALGHMMIGSYVNQISYGINTTTGINAVENGARTIENWFNNNSTWQAKASEYELYETVVSSSSGVQKIGWLEYVGPSTGEFRICKKSDTGDNLQGAVFTVGSQTYTTGSNGCTSYIEVDPQTLTYYETTPPSGYVGYSGAQSCTVTAGAQITCDAHTNSKIPTAYIKIKKVNSVNSGVSYAGLTVVGTVFSVKNSSGIEVATITIGSDGTGTSSTSLPVGTYTITEKSATTGYTTNSNSLTVTLNSNNTATSPATVDMTGNAFSNTPIYGKISLTKTGYEMTASGSAGSRNLAGVYFNAVNQSDSTVNYCIGPTGSDGTVTSDSMVYGDYTVTELTDAQAKANVNCQNASSTLSHNAAYNMLSFSTSITSTSTITISADQTNDTIPDNPGLTTVARNSNSTYENPDKELEIAPNAGVTDRITCSGLQSGAQYKLEGTLYKVSGATAVGSTGSAIFTADTNGTCPVFNGQSNADMVFSTFDTSNYIDQTLGITQVLYKNNGTSSSPDWVRIFIHNANLADADEQVKVKNIQITTTATTTRANNKELAAGTVTVNDSIQIIGLTNGQSYTIDGVVKDPSGNTVASNSTSYTMTAATGATVTTSLGFTLDSTPYVGKNLTVVLTLKNSSGATLVTHSVTDGSETVSVLTPEIGTTAINGRDVSLNEHELEVGATTIQDTVTYKGLVSGDTYIIKGEVHKLNSDGSDSGTVVSIATKSFTATGEDNSVGETLTFDIDTISSCAVNNKLTLPCKFVVYEYIYFGTHSSPFAKHENPSDTNQILSVKDPTITTAASDAQNDTKYLPLGTTTVIDRVTYNNLMPGQTYLLKGQLKDLTTGSIIASSNTESFPAASTTGTVTIDSFSTFDSVLDYDHTLGTNQRKYVVYQTLSFGDIELVTHASDTDTDQQVQLAPPTIHTTATWKVNDNIDDDTNLLGVGDVIMKDYVEYEGLVEGEWYTVIASIYNPETGETLEINDESIENSKTFKADAKGKGTVAIELNINTISLQGKSFVVYERLYRAQSKHGDGRLLDVHEEALNEGTQTFTVKIASIGTVAKDGTGGEAADGDDVIDHEDGQTIIDKVHYDGLLMEEEYTLYGYLWDKTNNRPLLDADGKRIEAYATFTTPKKKDNGDVEMSFSVDASNLPGVEIVVYEYLFSGDQDNVPLGDDGYPDTEQVVTKHEDPDDEDQIVRVSMRVGTEAVDAYDNDHTVGVGEVKIVDHLKYEGITIGKTYEAKGWLVYKNDGDGHKAGDKVQGIKIACEEVPITDDDDESNGEESGEEETETEQVCTRTHFDIEGTATFVAGSEGYEETTGYVLINLAFDSRELIGEEFVVYEELYLVNDDDTEDLVAKHKDLEDEGQTVVVDKPTIHTVATDKSDGDHELPTGGEVIITDKVSYTGLVPGTTYVLHGELIDKTSGNYLSANGVTEITWEFVPTGASGSEDLEFAINIDGLNGKGIVVFEELYILPTDNEDGDKIAEHKDLNDEDQTVWVGPSRPNTGFFTRIFEGGAESGIIVFIVGGIVTGLGGYAFIRRKTRVRRGEISFE